MTKIREKIPPVNKMAISPVIINIAKCKPSASINPFLTKNIKNIKEKKYKRISVILMIEAEFILYELLSID
ncbi:MAG: hypothetical protein ACYC3G_03095 [Minisyncoccota bacterium]